MSSEEVLQRDPAFAEALRQRTALSGEIAQLELVLRAEQNTVLQEIQQRRAALRAKERATQEQIQALEQRLDPTRQLVHAKLRETDDAVRRITATLQSVRRTRETLDRLIQHQQGGATAAPTADLQAWKTQRATMDQQIPVLDAQLAALRRQRALYQTERRLLRR
ncbi:MAG: hypothetical protein HY600_03095 [Candidatus Omnitrophica bacterium]|nr:hypothetical protein [Candidatus Omnitrophota bacterium]